MRQFFTSLWNAVWTHGIWAFLCWSCGSLIRAAVVFTTLLISIGMMLSCSKVEHKPTTSKDKEVEVLKPSETTTPSKKSTASKTKKKPSKPATDDIDDVEPEKEVVAKPDPTIREVYPNGQRHGRTEVAGKPKKIGAPRPGYNWNERTKLWEGPDCDLVTPPNLTLLSMQYGKWMDGFEVYLATHPEEVSKLRQLVAGRQWPVQYFNAGNIIAKYGDVAQPPGVVYRKQPQQQYGSRPPMARPYGQPY